MPGYITLAPNAAKLVSVIDLLKRKKHGEGPVEVKEQIGVGGKMRVMIETFIDSKKGGIQYKTSTDGGTTWTVPVVKTVAAGGEEIPV
jgi:Neuraminidase (sialidase)